MIMKLKLINVKYYDCESLCESLILYNRIVKFLNASTNRELLFCLNEKKKKGETTYFGLILVSNERNIT